jgi:multisubunit Na+/H+ antiporter MnhC subunit
MLSWRKQNALALMLVLDVALGSVLKAGERPYFEELDRVEILQGIERVDLKVVPGGHYVLASIDTTSQGVINVYELLPHEKGIRSKPVSSIYSDGYSNPLQEVATLEFSGDGDTTPIRVYVNSVAYGVNHSIISGYQMTSDGKLLRIKNSVIELGNFPTLVGSDKVRTMQIEGNLMFALTENAISTINIHSDGSLKLIEQHLIFPPDDKKHEMPRTLTYIPATEQLFIGLGYLKSKPLEDNLFLLIYSVNDDGSFNKTAEIKNMHFNKGVNFHNVETILAQSGVAETEKIALGVSVFNIKNHLDVNLIIIDPYSLKDGFSVLDVRMSDVIFSKNSNHLYVSSFVSEKLPEDIGLSAYRIHSNLSTNLISGSGLNTTHNHYFLELTLDGCHMLAVSGGGAVKTQDPYDLVLYRINDPEINCTTPSSPLPLALIISVPTAALSVIGLSMTTLFLCILVKKYGSRKGYAPIN